MKRELPTTFQGSSITAKVLSVIVSIILVSSLSIPAGLAYTQTAWADEETGQQDAAQEPQAGTDTAAALGTDEDTPASADEVAPAADDAAPTDDATAVEDDQVTVADDGTVEDEAPASSDGEPTALGSAAAAVQPADAEATLAEAGVATVNGQGSYATIQAAIDAVAGTAVSSETTFTITIKAGSYSGDIKIVQQLNKSIVLVPEQAGTVTINGQIIVDGGGNANSHNTALLNNHESVLIEGLAIRSTTTACVFLTDAATAAGMYYYSHNVTVRNCVFSGGSDTAGVRVGIGGQSYNPAVSNIVVQNCTASFGMHSLFQVSAPVQNLSITGCTTDGPKGINAIVLGSALVSDCNFNVSSGYAIRLGSGDSNVTLLGCDTQITDCNLTVSATTKADEGLIVLRGYAPDRFSLSGCTMSAGDGVYLINNTNAAQSANYQFSLTGNYWGSGGMNLSRVNGLGGNASLLASTYLTHTTYDANGGSFADSGTATSDATVAFKADGSTLTDFTFPSDPTNAGKTFLGWFTQADGGTQVAATGNAGFAGDVTLFAHWGEAEAVNTTTGVGYTSLADAISAANDGEALSLQKDVTVSSSIVIGAGKAITLDGGNHIIKGDGSVGTVGNAVANSLFIVDGGLSLKNATIANVGIGIRTTGVASHVDVSASSISASYYAIALRNVNQALTVSNSTLTAWAGIMTSGNDLGDNQQKPTNTSIVVTNTVINGKSRAVDQYGAIALQENYNGVTVSISGGSINLGWIDGMGSLARYSAIDVRAFASTVTIDGTAINADAAFPAGSEGIQGVILATNNSGFVGTPAKDTSIIATNLSFSNEIAENAKVAFRSDDPSVDIRDNVDVFIDGVKYIPSTDGSGVGVAQAMEVAADNVSVEYDGQYHSVSPQAKIAGAPANATITYWNDATKAYDLAAAPAFKDVIAAQTVKFKAVSGHYSATGSATVSITKRPVTLTSATASKTYDGTALTNKNVAVGGKGFVAGEAPTYAVTGSITDAGTVNNTFSWTFPANVKESNYSITKTVGILTVNKASLTVHVKGNTDALVQTGSPLQVSGFTYDNTDKVKVSLKDGVSARAQGTDVGSYTMGLSADSFTAASKNYNPTLEVTDGKLVIMAKSIEQQIADLGDRPSAEQVNAVVENIANLSQETRNQMHTPEAAQEITNMEDLYVNANENVEETRYDIDQNLVSSATVTGAALSVPLTGEPLHAELAIKATEFSGEIPTGIDATNLIPLEISLNLVNNHGKHWQDNVQPKAPITITMTVPDADGKLDVDNLRIVHYHEGNVEVIEPLNASRDGENVTVTFTLASLSPVLLANADAGSAPEPGNPDEGGTPIPAGGNNNGSKAPTTQAGGSGNGLAKTSDSLDWGVVAGLVLAAAASATGMVYARRRLFGNK